MDTHSCAHRIATALDLRVREAEQITIDNGKRVTAHAHKGQDPLLTALAEHLEQTRE